eukprot:gene48296-26692_t
MNSYGEHEPAGRITVCGAERCGRGATRGGGPVGAADADLPRVCHAHH